MMNPEDVMNAYDAIIQIYGHTAQEAAQKRSQALARLYAQANCSQAQLAQWIGHAQSGIATTLSFGRFLDWLDIQGRPHPVLTKGSFDRAWSKLLPTVDQTDQDACFTRIADHLGLQRPSDNEAQSTSTSAVALARLILEACSDGRWRPVYAIAALIGHEDATAQVQDICHQIVTRRAFHGWGEQRPAPPSQGGVAYRLVKGGGKKVDTAVLLAEFRPTLDRMKQLVYGHVVHFSQSSMKLAYEELRRTMDRVMTPTTRSQNPTHHTKDTTHVPAPQLDYQTLDPRSGPTVCHDGPLTDRTPVS